MLKYVLLGAAMAITAPALAQTGAATTPGQTATPQTSPTTDGTAGEVTAGAATPAQTDQAPVTTTDATPAQPAADATAAAQPATEATQVAQVVDSQFATYDKDGDGKLSEPEFAGWMVALKAQTDPKTDANSPATKKWNQAAFAQADTDKSKSVTKAELTGFLTPAAAKS